MGNRACFTKRHATGVVLAGALVVQSCTTVPTNDGRDNCSRFRAPLVKIVEEYNQRFVANAAVGATAGAGVGALVAKLFDKNVVVGALFGAAAGALAGLTIAYYQNQLNKADNNKRALQRAIDSDIDGARKNARSLGGAITALNQCRLEQLTVLEDKAIDGFRGPNEKSQLALIRGWIADDRSLIEGAVGDLSEGSNIFTDAYAKSRDVEESQVRRRSADYEPTVIGVPGAKQKGERAYATGSVRVRSGPGTSNRVIGGLVRGNRVNVLNPDAGRGWSEIAFGEQVGYVSSRFLSEKRPAVKPKLPKVDKRQKARGSNKADNLLIEVKDVQVNADAEAGYIDDTLDNVDALLK